MEHYYTGRGGELVTVDVRLLKEAVRPAEGAPFAITAIRGFVMEPSIFILILGLLMIRV